MPDQYQRITRFCVLQNDDIAIWGQTFESEKEAQILLEQIMANNSRDRLENLFYLPLHVGTIECYQNLQTCGQIGQRIEGNK